MSSASLRMCVAWILRGEGAYETRSKSFAAAQAGRAFHQPAGSCRLGNGSRARRYCNQTGEPFAQRKPARADSTDQGSTGPKHPYLSALEQAHFSHSLHLFRLSLKCVDHEVASRRCCAEREMCRNHKSASKPELAFCSRFSCPSCKVVSLTGCSSSFNKRYTAIKPDLAGPTVPLTCEPPCAN
jgi:hypothetical protein